MKKFLLLFFILPAFCFSQIPDSKPNTFVNDYCNVLTEAQIKELNDSILSIEKKSPTQIAILLLKEIPGGIEPAEYANNVGRQWHVGKDKSGIVYVAGIDQHKQGIGTALNIEASITDYECGRIMDEMKPYFRNKDYYGGLKHMVNEINKLIDPSGTKEESENNIWIFIIVIIVIVAVILYFITKPEKENKDNGDNYMPPLRRSYGSSDNSIAHFATGYAAGSYMDNSSNNDSSSSPSSSSYSSDSSSDSGSSYGNFDSGSSGDSGFSGGGASSDW